MAAMRVLFTVFTPTYNRAHLLPGVYQSLLAQSCQDFEWLVIDDGSDDDTASVMAPWLAAQPFPIRYHRQAHGHKKAAFNTAVQMARGELFLPLDSDDRIVPEALDCLKSHWQTIADDARFTGISARCMDEHGRLCGAPLPTQVFDSDSNSMFYRWRHSGEKWGFHRTDILKAYPFPAYLRGHVPESIVWSAIARRYCTRYIDIPLREYIVRPDSITIGEYDPQGPSRNAEGHTAWAAAVLQYDMRWCWHRPWHFLLTAVNFQRFYRHIAPQRRHLIAMPRHPMAQVLLLLAWPLGWLRYRLDCRRMVSSED